MTFGEKLQKLRRSAGLSQEQLAGELEISRQAVSRWELGESLPDTGRLLTLSRRFGVTVDYLLKEEIEEPGDFQPGASEGEKPASTGKGLLIGAICTGGLGSLGFLVIWVLSTMIESRGRLVYEREDMTVYTSEAGYTFAGFVETYRLGALLLIFGGLLVAAVILLWNWWKKKSGFRL